MDCRATHFLQTVFARVCEHSDYLDIVSFTQTCRGLYYFLSEEDYKKKVWRKNRVFLLEVSHRQSWRECFIELAIRPSEKKVLAPHSFLRSGLVLPSFVTLELVTNISHNELLPLDFECIGKYRLQEMQVPDDTVIEPFNHGHQDLYVSQQSPEPEDALSTDTHNLDAVFTSRHGMSVHHGFPASKVTAVVSTPKMLAILINVGEDGCRLFITYKVRTRPWADTDLINHFGEDARCCHIFGAEGVLIICIRTPGTDLLKVIFDTGTSLPWITRTFEGPRSNLCYFLYDGYIWDVRFGQTEELGDVLVIQTVCSSKEPTIVFHAIPGGRYKVVQEPLWNYRYLVFYYDTAPVYLVDMAAKKVYAWKPFDLVFDYDFVDRVLLGMSEEQIGVWTYDHSLFD